MSILVHNNLLKLLAVAVGATLLISACGNGGVDAVISDAVDEDPSSVVEIGELPTTVSDVSSDDGSAPALGFALGDPELHATDQSTVSFASGQIQVIEFFAFW